VIAKPSREGGFPKPNCYMFTKRFGSMEPPPPQHDRFAIMLPSCLLGGKLPCLNSPLNSRPHPIDCFFYSCVASNAPEVLLAKIGTQTEPCAALMNRRRRRNHLFDDFCCWLWSTCRYRYLATVAQTTLRPSDFAPFPGIPLQYW